MITTGNHPKLLWPGVKATFGAAYDEHSMVCDQIFDSEPSDKAYEEYVQMIGFGLAPVKDQGASVSYEDTQQGYVQRLTHIVYALAATVSEEAIEDNLYEQIATRLARYLGFSIRQTRENVAHNIFNRAFNSTYTGGDGKELCATDHPNVSGTFQNEPTVSVDFSEQALEDLMVLIMNATDPKGLKISLMPKKLIIPTALTFEATRVLESVGRPGTANNDVNAIKNMGLLQDGALVSPYLTDTDAWFVKTNAPEGLINLKRRATRFAKDNDFDTGNAKMKADIREAWGWVDPLCVFGSEGA